MNCRYTFCSRATMLFVLAIAYASALTPLALAVPLAHPVSESKATAWLADLGCPPPPPPNFMERFQLPIIIALLITLAFGAWWAGPRLAKREIKLDVGNLILAGTLLLTLYQWHSSLEQQARENEQQAIQKYEGEISAMNQAAMSDSIHAMMAPLYPQLKAEALPDYGRIEYVYLQLDNLEYAVERYRLSLASAYTTARAVMTFESRCRNSREFRDRVEKQVALASYSPVVRQVVTKVLATF